MEQPVPYAFFLPGGSTSVLLLHGLTGSAAEMRRLGGYLHARNLTVLAPLLPGHGTTPADLHQQRWQDWLDHAGPALAELRARCRTVFLAGQSLGALLALHLAAGRRDQISGAVLYAPALQLADRLSFLVPFAKHLIQELPKGEDDFVDKGALSSLWDYDVYSLPSIHELQKLSRRTRKLLPQVTCPLLILHGTCDQMVRPAGAQLIRERAGSHEKELVFVHNSGHVLTLDAEWEYVAERTYQFIRHHAASSFPA